MWTQASIKLNDYSLREELTVATSKKDTTKQTKQTSDNPDLNNKPINLETENPILHLYPYKLIKERVADLPLEVHLKHQKLKIISLNLNLKLSK